jgi:SNF2 family DNA or RNA helicase
LGSHEWCHQFVIDSRHRVAQYCGLKEINPLSIVVEPFLAQFMREHQRQGVQFMFDCVTGKRPSDGFGCILADDMVNS